MRLYYVGHAGWLFEESGFSVLCDPWKTEHGAFFSSWFPFPANDHVRLPHSVDAIYISHAHQDHFSPETLADFSRATQIIIADFEDPVLVDELTALGFKNIRRLPDGGLVTIGCFSLQIFLDEDGGMYHDSALVVRSPSATVLNLNDCRLSESWLNNLGRIDLLLGQFSGANWYPSVYDYPAAVKDHLAAAKRFRGLNRLLRHAESCQAAVTIPCAGPPAFLDESLWYLNDLDDSDRNPFPTMPIAVEFLQRSRSAFLAMPGDTLELVEAQLTLKHRTLNVDEVYECREQYLVDYSQRKRPYIHAHLAAIKRDKDTGLKLIAELNRVVAVSPVLACRVQSVVRFELLGIPNGDILWDCINGLPAARPYRGEPVNYRFSVDSRLVADLLHNKWVNFEDLFLSLRFNAWRDPDVFDNSLFTLLVNFDSVRLRNSEAALTVAALVPPPITFELEHNGVQYAVQRRCPHMGADLSLVGQVHDGIITCTRHGWQFHLTDGKCLNVSSPSIAVCRLSGSQVMCAPTN